MLLLMLFVALSQAMPGRCGTSSVAFSVPFPGLSETPPPPGGLGERDVYGVSNALSSEHFVVRWGPDGGVDDEDAQAILDAMEFSWDVQVEQMAYPQPEGTSQMRLNVYVVGTGEGPPEHEWFSGYFTTDSQGWPMIALDRKILSSDEYTKLLSAHELHHAVQHATGRYLNSTGAAWYREATASWVEAEVYPELPRAAEKLFAFALLPWLAVEFNSPTDEFERYYQYGAFIFPRYVSEKLGGWEMIRDSWTSGTERIDPLNALDAELASDGLELGPVIADMYSHNATWDYEKGDEYEEVLDYYLNWSSYDPLADVYSSPGTGGMAQVPLEMLPERFGANLIRLDGTDGGTLTVQIAADAVGSAGSAASWHGRLALDSGDSVDYVEIPFDESNGAITVDLPESVEAVYMVVVPEAPSYFSDETFDYAFELIHVPPPPDLEDLGTFRGAPPGCSASPHRVIRSAPTGLFLLVSALLAATGSRREKRALVIAPASRAC